MDFPITVSVVMATYNTDIPMLKEAVDSILCQTFVDFEFLIIDDGSTNGSGAYLDSIRDARVRILRNPRNIGVTKSLNIGLREAKGKYIARMDADDVSLPTRLEKEAAFMEAHPDVIACGTNTGTIIGEKRELPAPERFMPADWEEYRIRLLFINPGPRHPTAMIRHEPLIEHHILYDERLIHAQDYGLWETLSHYGKIRVLDEALLYRRMHPGQITASRRDVQIECDKMTQKNILTALLGQVSDDEVDLHYTHSTGYYKDAIITPQVAAWYSRLMEANRTRHIYDERKLEKAIILIEKILIRQTYRPDMSALEKTRMIFRYLPLATGLKMVAGNIKRGLLR